ncbi:hypothetical protein KIS1582_0471 [Cytobacillus firmus]|uniref:Uncharacterized protein n=1 Tax=Cytobacillus firmus TaxID=1399 RepID=A0A800NFU3_CYTFI|nr:hypothetical protein KIS1582_0471 [Cytobacillus firmus]
MKNNSPKFNRTAAKVNWQPFSCLIIKMAGFHLYYQHIVNTPRG